MSITKDLLLSILSMDAYNRGYHSGMSGLSDAADTQIGTVKINKRLQDVSETFEAESQAAGFYAVSYTLNTAVGDMAAGETIISYRGTDDPLGDVDGSDLWTGWTIGAGLGVPGSQSALAFQFYEAATGNVVHDGAQNDVTLIGHSLGGGLAGLVAAGGLISKATHSL